MAIMYSDCMDLLSTFSLMGRTNPIHLYAPENYDKILKSHLSDFDINLSFEIDFIPLSGKNPVKILDDKYLTVTSFPLKAPGTGVWIPLQGKNIRQEYDKRVYREV